MTLLFRKALGIDLPALERLLTEDELGMNREDGIADILFIPDLSRGGARRGQIEAVRVA